jgi:hypothetical protein
LQSSLEAALEFFHLQKVQMQPKTTRKLPVKLPSGLLSVWEVRIIFSHLSTNVEKEKWSDYAIHETQAYYSEELASYSSDP